jgi:hypothetical protein
MEFICWICRLVMLQFLFGAVQIPAQLLTIDDSAPQKSPIDHPFDDGTAEELRGEFNFDDESGLVVAPLLLTGVVLAAVCEQRRFERFAGSGRFSIQVARPPPTHH